MMQPQDKIRDLLEQSIQTMRDACNQAERDLMTPQFNPVTKAARVLHALSWGFANASSGIEGAIHAAKDQMEWDKAMAEEGRTP